MRIPFVLAALLSLTPAYAVDGEVKAVPFLEPTVGVEIGPLNTTPIFPTKGPALAPGLEAVFSETPMPLEAMQEALVAPKAATMPLPTVSAALSQGIVPDLAAQNEVISNAAVHDVSGLGEREGVDQIYFGKGRDRRSGGSSSFGDGGVYAGGARGAQSGDRITAEGMTIGPAGTRGQIDPASPQATFIVNGEGIPLTGRAADYHLESNRMERVLKSKGADIRESKDVLDDSNRDVLAKLKIIKAVGAEDSLAQNVHLPETLTWVDAIKVEGDKKIAVHTMQVYFHTASGEAKSQSEIQEGIRRIDKSIDESLAFFAKGGKADQEVAKLDSENEQPLDQAILGFDTRGYQEIKDHILSRVAAIRAEHGDRFRFEFLPDADARLSKEQVRRELAALVKQYRGHGLQRIIEGVLYSRETGRLLEYKGIEYRLAQGATILQSGRDLFNDGVDDAGRAGMYETELDVVSRARDGQIDMDEEKSARVALVQQDVLDDKFLYKLETYKRNRALLVRKLGGVPRINFVVDVGGIDRQAALEGRLQWKNPVQLELVRFLQSKEKELSETYGFQVKFVFLASYPGVDPYLYIHWLAQNSDPANDKAVLKQMARERRKAEKARRKHGRP